MKHLLLFFVLFIFTTNLIAQKLDTVYSDKWKNNEWQRQSRVMNHYDASCQTTDRFEQGWDATLQVWTNVKLTTYTYITTNVIGEALNQSWNANTNTWGDPFKQTLSYDQSLRLISDIGEQWTNDKWELSYKETYTRDQYGNYDSILIENFFDGQVIRKYLTTYYYNNDNTIDSTMSQSWDNYTMVWSTPGITHYSYNADRTINQIISGSSRTTYTYNSSGKAIRGLTERLINGNWENAALATYTYNANNDYTEFLYQDWNAGLNSWDNSFRSSVSYGYNCVLPLKLLSFTAQIKDKTALLNWQTVNEINTSHFIVQRSPNGTSFINIGNVVAKGNSNLDQQYAFTEQVGKINGDKIYYRLQMVDKDGKYTFSKIVPITLMAYTGNIKTYPNPAKDQLYLTFDSQNETTATVKIADASGKIIKIQTVNIAGNNISVNVNTLTRGIYYVQIITKKGIQRTSFIKE